MKICLNILAGTAGGQLTRARAFLDRFERHAHDCELMILKERQVLPEYASRRGREVLDVGIGLGRLKAPRRMIWETLTLPPLLRERRVDVYLTFSHYLPSTFPQDIPSVVGVSNLAPFSDLAWTEELWAGRLKMALLRRSIVASARRASSVIALSNACRFVLEQSGISAGKIETIPNGVDDFWRQRNDIKGERLSLNWDRFLLYVSHFHRYKNHVRLLQAYAQLPEALRHGTPLVLIGRPYDDRYYREILALRERLGLREQVVIQQKVEGAALRTLYQRTTLFVFPSMIENCPNILLEAMAAGAPVLASNQQPMPEFGGDAAVYFDPLNVRALAGKMEALISDRVGRERMGNRAAVLAQQYSWDGFVGHVINLCVHAFKTSASHVSCDPSRFNPQSNGLHAH